jgi:hypothetical protein
MAMPTTCALNKSSHNRLTFSFFECNILTSGYIIRLQDYDTIGKRVGRLRLGRKERVVLTLFLFIQIDYINIHRVFRNLVIHVSNSW